MLGIVALSFWAGIWAFANRLLTHRFDFLRHLAVSCLASMGSICLWTLSEYAEFFFSPVVVVTQASLVALLIHGHLAIHPGFEPTSSARLGLPCDRRRGWAHRFADLCRQEDYSSDVVITVPLKRLGADWVPTVSTEEFLERSRRTKTWVAKRRPLR